MQWCNLVLSYDDGSVWKELIVYDSEYFGMKGRRSECKSR